jgi:hypothetical protein
MAAATSTNRIKLPFVFFRRRPVGGGVTGASLLPGSEAGRTGGIFGSVAVVSPCVSVSLTLLVINCYPLMNVQNEIERFDGSTSRTVELTDGFV